MRMKELRFAFGLVSVLCFVLVANGTQTAFRVGGPFGDSEREFVEGSSPTTFIFEGRISDYGNYYSDFHYTDITIQVYNDSLTESQTLIDYCYVYDLYSDDYHEYTDSKWLHVCGGTLISENTVVTSARCVNDYVAMVHAGGMLMRAGVGWDVLIDGVNGTNHQTYSVVNITIHPDYDPESPQNNNIAVVRLSHNVTLQWNVKIAQLANGTNDHYKERCMFNGWGSTKCEVDNEHPRANWLQVAVLKVISNEVCDKIWNLKSREVLGAEVCAVNWVKHSTLCDGDFGGGLMCPTGVNDNEFELMGVASWNDASCNGCMPAVFARIPDYRDWLVGKIANFGPYNEE